MLWTPLPQVGLWVLNLLSPAGSVFWDAGDGYAMFAAGQSRHAQQWSLREAATREVSAVLRESGVAQRSFASQVVFGGITRSFGARFLPDELDPEFFLLAQRHGSIAVPEGQRSAVSRYFQRQAATFGARAFRVMDENLDAAGATVDTEALAMFSLGVDALSPAQREGILALFIAGAWHPGREFALVHACRGVNVALHAPVREADRSVAEALLRYRVAAVLGHGALPGIEATRAGLESPGWSSLALADLREELRGELDTVLSLHPLLQTDPFSQQG
ncbi:MAG TPA: hypothetical protein VGD42_18240 [Lysobacter sp.]